jgi:hypothetical protein
MSEAPSVDVRTVLMPPRDLMTALQKGVVDLAMGSFPDFGGSDILFGLEYCFGDVSNRL